MRLVRMILSVLWIMRMALLKENVDYCGVKFKQAILESVYSDPEAAPHCF
jgi:hypothetical protein